MKAGQFDCLYLSGVLVTQYHSRIHVGTEVLQCILVVCIYKVRTLTFKEILMLLALFLDSRKVQLHLTHSLSLSDTHTQTQSEQCYS